MEGRLAPLRVRPEDGQRQRPNFRKTDPGTGKAVVKAPRPSARVRHRNEVFFSYLVMVAALLVATLLRMALSPLLKEQYPFATFTLAVITVSGLRGLRPGLLAALAGAAIGIPVFAGADVLVDPKGITGLCVYLATSVTVAVLCGSFRSARTQAEMAASLAKERQARLERETEAREEAQDAAREADDRTRKLLDRIAESMLTLDMDWQVLYANDNAARLLHAGEGLEGKRLTEVLSGDFRTQLMERLQHACDSGLPTRFELIESSTKEWIEYRAYPTPDGVTLFARDITEERRTRIALEESEERYRAFLAQSSEAIWRFELDKPVAIDLPLAEQIDAFYQYGYLAECNDTMARQYGYHSAGEIIGKRLGDLLPRGDARSTEYLRNFIRSNFRLESAESTDLDKKGHRHVYVNNLLGIEKDGLLLRAWGTQRDITQQKLAEAAVRNMNSELEKRVEERTLELRSANKELEAFCYSVSHDLRAPLRSVISQSNILLEDHSDRLDGAGVASLHRLIKTAKNMATTIDDLIELSKLQRIDMQKEEVDFSGLAEFVAQELCSRGTCLSTEFVIQGGLSAFADKGLLRVALMNLMENACKFASKGEHPRVEIGCVTVNGVRSFFVRDNGVGFDMRYVDKIFRPFERLHRAEDYPGTGIGLANVERVVERHGGRVWAEGELGKGATFFFTLESLPQN
jgi:PAS domain S-box-containing protein